MTLRERLQAAKLETQGRTWSHEDDFILWFVRRELIAERRDALQAADAFAKVRIKRGLHRIDGDPLAERRDET